MEHDDPVARGSFGREWFCVRCIFAHPSDEQSNDGVSRVYEERLTLWQASSREEAFSLAEAEAEEYATNIGCEYVSFAQAYRVPGEPEPGAEVFSLMRPSGLEPDDYVDKFFDTGVEIEEVVEPG